MKKVLCILLALVLTLGCASAFAADLVIYSARNERLNNIVIPGTVQKKDMVGQVLELMGYYSKTLVQQKYYDEVLQLRVSEAPDDRDMVELIYNTVVFDPGIAFCDGNSQLWNLVYLPCFAVLNKDKNISSYYQKNARGAQRWLDNLFTKVE